MRFLFVYQDCAVPARQLLSELSVRDVTLVVATKNAERPSAEELELLKANQGAPAAACQLTRRYRKSVAPYVVLEWEPKKFRADDKVLRGWLRPATTSVAQVPVPSEAVSQAVKGSANLVLAPGALDEANGLVEHRHEFVFRAVGLLARYADGADLGPLREWKSRHGVEFAANGRVAFKYEVTCGDEVEAATTEWHLKEGDYTTRESAARLYFERVHFLGSGTVKIIVFFVGPHPSDGTHSSRVTIDKE